MMELDEAIRHAEEKAKELESTCALWKRLSDERGLSIPSDYEPCKKCAEEHEQLAEWLKELKRVREQPWLKELKRLREQTRWIPCSERLPEEDGRFLVFLPDRKGTFMCADFLSGKWYPDDYECTSNHVIAWMPLPKPYKEEGGEK